MTTANRAEAYLSLAGDLINGTVSEEDLAVVTAQLPLLDKQL
jgi:hypothetical protein